MRVIEHPDGIVAVFHSPWCVAHYDATNQLIKPEAESGLQKDSIVRARDRPIVAPRATVANKSRRNAEMLGEGKSRTDRVRHPPDNVTCYLPLLASRVAFTECFPYGVDRAMWACTRGEIGFSERA